MVLPLAIAARCSSPVRQRSDSAARPWLGRAKSRGIESTGTRSGIIKSRRVRLGTPRIRTAEDKPAGAQVSGQALKQALKPASRKDLDIGSCIGSSMRSGAAETRFQPSFFQPTLGETTHA